MSKSNFSCRDIYIYMHACMTGNEKACTIKKGNDRYLWPGVEHSRCVLRGLLFSRGKIKTINRLCHSAYGGWGGGVGRKTKKKFMQGKMPKKKFIQKEGPIVTFSESLSFRNQQYYQAQYEKTKITFFLLKGDN